MTPTPEDLAGAVLTIDLVALKDNWRRLNTRPERQNAARR